jgi:hypothetical protein
MVIVFVLPVSNVRSRFHYNLGNVEFTRYFLSVSANPGLLDPQERLLEKAIRYFELAHNTGIGDARASEALCAAYLLKGNWELAADLWTSSQSVQDSIFLIRRPLVRSFLKAVIFAKADNPSGFTEECRRVVFSVESEPVFSTTFGITRDALAFGSDKAKN